MERYKQERVRVVERAELEEKERRYKLVGVVCGALGGRGGVCWNRGMGKGKLKPN